MLRRNFLRSIVGVVLASLTGLRPTLGKAAETARFDHGVASGDPLSDGFILWTRISGASGDSLPVRWMVASDPDMNQIVRHGVVWTDDWSDYTVKADVRGLPSGSTFYYRFEIGGVESAVGRGERV